jgi:hypothetical protein
MNIQEKQYTEIINFRGTPEMKEFQNQLRDEGKLLGTMLRKFIEELMEKHEQEKKLQEEVNI